MIRKLFSKTLALSLALIATLTSLAACDNQTQAEIPVSLPEYANDIELNMLGYVNPTNGNYTFDDIPMNIGKDFRTVEYFKEYMDAGFNIALARYDSALPANITAETWPNSDTKLFCDVAYEAGIRKILITDRYFDDLSGYTENIIGTLFASQEEMDEAIAARLSIYKDTPGFYGIFMLDEPSYKLFDNYALVSKSLKRVMPDIYLFHNLIVCFSGGISSHFVDVDAWKEEHDGQAPTLGEAYRQYIFSFLEKTEAENLSVDIYPFKDRPEERVSNFFSNIQVLREACDTFGIDMSFTMQSISYTQGEAITNRTVNKSDLWLQMNTLLGFGAKNLQYYTYFPHPSKHSTRTNIGNFVDQQGNKTSVYYNAKSVNDAVRNFDEILLHYEFQGAKMHLNKTIQNGSASNYISSGSTEFNNSWEHTLLTSLTQNNDALLVTELKDSKNDLYMYMVMNAIDSLFSMNGEMSYTECTFTAEFAGYDYVAEFDCGELRYVKLDNGKYTKSLSSGYAVYLVPLKVA